MREVVAAEVERVVVAMAMATEVAMAEVVTVAVAMAAGMVVGRG